MASWASDVEARRGSEGMAAGDRGGRAKRPPLSCVRVRQSATSGTSPAPADGGGALSHTAGGANGGGTSTARASARCYGRLHAAA